jgi:hypothetical protein
LAEPLRTPREKLPEAGAAAEEVVNRSQTAGEVRVCICVYMN